MTEQSTEAAARRRYEEEESRRREERIAELEREETARREREERERERLEAVDRAREEAERLTYERGALADQAEREIGALTRTLQELAAADRLHRTALQASGSPLPSLFLDPVVQRWIGDRLSNPENPGPHDDATLRERDPLSPS